MNGYLADTSIWIDYFNKKKESSQIQIFRTLLESEARICICPVVYQEILQGVRDDKEFERIKRTISVLDMLDTDIITASDYAIGIYRTLRKKGLTVRKSQDCLVAAYAMLENLILLHNDRDFDTIYDNFS